jgi:hypothetical protein
MRIRAASSRLANVLVSCAMSASLVACLPPQQGGEGGAGGGVEGGGGGGGEGPTGCDARKTCEDCATCASQTTCAEAIAACQDNPVCVGLDECMLYCQGDADCDEMCRLQNAAGLEEWDRAARCLYCDACPTACSGSRFCE